MMMSSNIEIMDARDPVRDGIVFADMIIDPPKLGTDLRLSRLLKLRGDKPDTVFRVTSSGRNIVYTFLYLDANRDGTYTATVNVVFNEENLHDQDPRREKDLSDAWLRRNVSDPLDRRDFIHTMCGLIELDDIREFCEDLMGAVLNRGPEMEQNIMQKWRETCDGKYAALYHVPLSVCVQCNLHTLRKQRQCCCREGFYYCSTACQKAHWRAGHKDSHLF